MEERLMQLEIRLAFMEREVQELSEVLRETRDLLDHAQREVKSLREQLNPETPFDLRAEVPPHY